jgi:peptidyl-prolyl cis-trans isomerase B (cyclophilin B)
MTRLIPLAALVLLAGCGGNPDPVTNVSSCEVEIVDPARATEITPLEAGKTYTIRFETSHGNFTVELDPERSPCNGASMMKLANEGFYNGITIHRIVPGFVIQAGRSEKTPAGGPGYSTIDPPLPETQYPKGSVSMAKATHEPPGTGGSEFFIATGNDLGLPPDYAPVGRISEGMDVVEKIGKLGNIETEQPTEKIVIKRAEASNNK